MKAILSILTLSFVLAGSALQAGENCQTACAKAKATSCDKATAASCDKAKAASCDKAKASCCEKQASVRKALLTHKGAYIAKR